MLPSRIGPYEIKSEIGGNERGRVYEAFDPRSNRKVAVKAIASQSLFTPTSKRKFDEQLARLQALKHPGLMPIVDFGDEDNRPYFVMPLMIENLTRKMEAGPAAVDEAVEWFQGFASALDQAASAGVIHNDIKPNNVLFDEHGHGVIGDLGIVQVIESLSAANKPTINPYYTSPEQVRRRNLTGLSQQYSLAALLFHVLSGQVLFGGATELVASFKHTSERPRNIRQLRPELNEVFGEVLLKALSKDPAHRFRSSGEFMANLARAKGGTLTIHEVQGAWAGPPRAAQQIPSAPPRIAAPAIRPQQATTPAQLRMLLVLGFSLSICICAAVGMVLSLAQSP